MATAIGSNAVCCKYRNILNRACCCCDRLVNHSSSLIACRVVGCACVMSSVQTPTEFGMYGGSEHGQSHKRKSIVALLWTRLELFMNTHCFGMFVVDMLVLESFNCKSEQTPTPRSKNSLYFWEPPTPTLRSGNLFCKVARRTNLGGLAECQCSQVCPG